MYTVARFILEGSNDIALLEECGREINQYVSGFFDTLDRRPGRFSGTVERSDNWVDHNTSMVSFLDKCQGVIRDTYKSGITVQLDTALGPEDYKGRVVTSFMLTSDLIERMAALQVTFVFSLY